jgi:MAF protein
MRPFVLASGSPRRRELLASLGVTFSVVRPQVDETQHPDEPPRAYAARLSREKAAAVAAQVAPASLVLAADTIVICDDRVLGKPADVDEATAMLRTLRGRAHTVCTAITLHSAAHDPLTEVTCTAVHMRAYSDAEIAAYIATGDPFDKAGGYAIQHPEFAPVAQIEGSYSNVVGLPLETLQALLTRVDYPTKPTGG